jgi:hypothetical protein
VRRAREIPNTDGARRTAAFLDTLNRTEIERKVALMFRRSEAHLTRAGLGRLFDSTFAPAWTDEEEL